LDEKYDIGVQDPPDLEGDIVNIYDLQTTAIEDQEHIVARVLATKIVKAL
jgi:hypothetical protein